MPLLMYLPLMLYSACLNLLVADVMRPAPIARQKPVRHRDPDLD